MLSEAVGLRQCEMRGSVLSGDGARTSEGGQEEEVWDDGEPSEKAQSKAGCGRFLLCPPGETVVA